MEIRFGARSVARNLFNFNWSGRADLNRGPPAPKAGALPGCATPRLSTSYALVSQLNHRGSCAIHATVLAPVNLRASQIMDNGRCNPILPQDSASVSGSSVLSLTCRVSPT